MVIAATKQLIHLPPTYIHLSKKFGEPASFKEGLLEYDPSPATPRPNRRCLPSSLSSLSPMKQAMSETDPVLTLPQELIFFPQPLSYRFELQLTHPACSPTCQDEVRCGKQLGIVFKVDTSPKPLLCPLLLHLPSSTSPPSFLHLPPVSLQCSLSCTCF